MVKEIVVYVSVSPEKPLLPYPIKTQTCGVERWHLDRQIDISDNWNAASTRVGFMQVGEQGTDRHTMQHNEIVIV